MRLENIDEEVITVKQAAEETGVSQQAIRNAVYQGKLPARQILDRLLIRRVDFDAYLETKRPPGWPKKQQ